MNVNARRVVAALLATVATSALATGCSSSSAASGSGPVRVVAGENFWGNVIQQIGGSHVSVTSIISDPNTDPHEYESDAHDGLEVAKAQLVVQNGVGYDDFLSKLESASPSSGRKVLTVATVMGIGGSNPNPHLWYDTAKLPEVATAFADELAAIDPHDASTFRAGAKTFSASLAPIEQVIAQIRAKYAGAKVAYTERVPGYLIAAAGLELGVPTSFTQAVEDGTDPSAAATRAFDSAITTRAVKVLLYNGQVTDPQTDAIKKLATSSGVPIVGVTETLPKQDKDFQAWQLRQAKEILAALAKG